MDQTLAEKPMSEFLTEYSVDSKHIVYEESSLIKSLEGLRSYTPLPSEREEKNAYIERIVRQWFSQRMRSKYDELSPEIFELERRVGIGKKHFKDSEGNSGYSNEKYTLDIPMLLQAELDREEGWATELKYNGSSYRDTYKFTLFSRIPKVPFNVRRTGRDALVFAYRTFADALNTEILGDVITEHPTYAPHPDNAKLVVLWKPKPSEIHIKAEIIDSDPALVLNWDKPYLVSTWREPNEEPFMHFISTGRVPNLDMFLDETKNYNLDAFLEKTGKE